MPGDEWRQPRRAASAKRPRTASRMLAISCSPPVILKGSGCVHGPIILIAKQQREV
jgi:hypothetical protein